MPFWIKIIVPTYLRILKDQIKQMPESALKRYKLQNSIITVFVLIYTFKFVDLRERKVVRGEGGERDIDFFVPLIYAFIG